MTFKTATDEPLAWSVAAVAATVRSRARRLWFTPRRMLARDLTVAATAARWDGKPEP
jgi:hypothetical protein